MYMTLSTESNYMSASPVGDGNGLPEWDIAIMGSTFQAYLSLYQAKILMHSLEQAIASKEKALTEKEEAA